MLRSVKYVTMRRACGRIIVAQDLHKYYMIFTVYMHESRVRTIVHRF